MLSTAESFQHASVEVVLLWLAGCCAHLQAGLVGLEDGELRVGLLLDLVVAARQAKRAGFNALCPKNRRLKCIQAHIHMKHGCALVAAWEVHQHAYYSAHHI